MEKSPEFITNFFRFIETDSILINSLIVLLTWQLSLIYLFGVVNTIHMYNQTFATYMWYRLRRAITCMLMHYYYLTMACMHYLKTTAIFTCNFLLLLWFVTLLQCTPNSINKLLSLRENPVIKGPITDYKPQEWNTLPVLDRNS